jgi:hypothetical protein
VRFVLGTLTRGVLAAVGDQFVDQRSAWCQVAVDPTHFTCEPAGIDNPKARVRLQCNDETLSGLPIQPLPEHGWKDETAAVP